jgi:hypothetical protein
MTGPNPNQPAPTTPPQEVPAQPVPTPTPEQQPPRL